jgi:hypothetical protein
VQSPKAAARIEARLVPWRSEPSRQTGRQAKLCVEMAKARIAESTLTSEGSASLSTVSCTLRHRDGVGPASHVQAERPGGATCASRPLSLDVTRHRLAPTLAKPPMVLRSEHHTRTLVRVKRGEYGSCALIPITV